MKYYFFSFISVTANIQGDTFNDVSKLHPIEIIVDWNKQFQEQNKFYTLVSFCEITEENYRFYKSNEPFI